MLSSTITMSSPPSTSTSKLALLIFTATVFFALTNCDTTFYTCSDTEFLSESTYEHNLVDLLVVLTTNTPATGYAETTAGRPPAAVYGHSLCRGDLNTSQCQACVSLAAEDALQQCPGKRRAVLWYDFCRIRYSDEPFFATVLPNVKNSYYYSFTLVPNRDVFGERIGKLLNALREEAMLAEKPGLFAAGDVEFADGERLYGMVQCTRDLGVEECKECLETPIQRAVCCMKSEEVTFLGGSCYLKYSRRLFYDPTAAWTDPSAVHESAAAAAAGEKPASKKGFHKSLAFFILISIGAAILLVVLGIVLKMKIKRKPKHITLGRTVQLQEGGGLKFHRLSSKKVSLFQNSTEAANDVQKLDLQTMRIATDNFSDSKRLGRGEFGPSFKGEIHGREFVIKRLTGLPQVGQEDLKKEYRSLKQINHPNIVKLLACHIEGVDRLLVYEYLPNTSLDKVLFDPKKRVLLDWGRRYRIIEGIGRGLLQLHQDSRLNIIHQNLKASNILLDKNMNPKLSDFCLPKLFIGNQNHANSRRTAASQGYTENVANSSYTTKTDIFSYGVLILEIVTGQRNRDFLGSENTTNLLSYVYNYWKEEKALQVLDWSLGEMYKGHEVLRCIHVGLLCVQADVDKRLDISTIIDVLNSDSFTLPSPSVPSVTRARRLHNHPPRSEGPRNGGSGSWDWKVFNQNMAQLSPQSPSQWSDVALDSNGETRR